MIETEKATNCGARRYRDRPLAFMRGRTLNDSFIILDEAQNTTSEQMKISLPSGFQFEDRHHRRHYPDRPASGRTRAHRGPEDHEGIEGIHFIYFTNKDVVRHKLVQQIIKAYEQYEGQNGQQE